MKINSFFDLLSHETAGLFEPHDGLIHDETTNNEEASNVGVSTGTESPREEADLNQSEDNEAQTEGPNKQSDTLIHCRRKGASHNQNVSTIILSNFPHQLTTYKQHQIKYPPRYIP